MKTTTSVKPGSMVQLINDLTYDPMYNTRIGPGWEDFYFLRDQKSGKIMNGAWIKAGEICLVISGEPYSPELVILSPRGHVGCIGKEKLEFIK